MIARKTGLLFAAPLALLVACGGGERSAPRYTAQLEPLNGSGVAGTAELTLAGDDLVVRIDATGLRRNRIHGQAIHRPAPAGARGECPTSEEDRDGNGRLEAGEARSAYGRPVLRLAPFPTVGADGRLDYDLTFRVDPRELGPLAESVVVLRGADAPARRGRGRRYQPSLPAACGQLEQR